jgi:hypothetical protein
MTMGQQKTIEASKTGAAPQQLTLGKAALAKSRLAPIQP